MRAGASWQMVCTSSSHAGCIAAALGLTVRSHFLAGRGLAPPVNRADLPEVEFSAFGAKHLSRPAETLLQLLQNSDLRANGTANDAVGKLKRPGAKVSPLSNAFRTTTTA